MPHHLSHLRLLLSSPLSPSLSFNPLLRLPFLFYNPRAPRSSTPALSVLCYSGRRGRRPFSGGGGGNIPQKRSSSTMREDRTPEMEAKDGAGFNKRRAEGRDKSAKPKTLHLKSRKLNPVNTICYVQILGTGMDTQDTSPSVLLFFDKQRFIFNAGEGLQRFCTEHKIKLSKIDHMFLTRVCSETAGGLPGLLLTLAGMGEEGMSINIWGPSELRFLIDAMRSFIPNAAMVHTHSFGLSQKSDGVTLSTPDSARSTDPIVLIDDEVVRISAIPLRPSYSKVSGIDDSNTSYLGSSGRDGSSNLFQSSLDNLGSSDIAVIYACELPEIKGKFNPNIAAELGLKSGPKYRQLQLGNSVMSDDKKKMVHPNDVLGPSSPGPIVLLVDCPTPFHIPELLSLDSLKCYYLDSADHPTEGTKVVNCVIHLGPASVTKNVDYQKWMKNFGSAKHIMAGHEIKNMKFPILKASARISARLNYICPQLFPAPGFSLAHNINNIPSESNGSCEDLYPSLCDSIPAENLLKFHLRPNSQLGLDQSAIPSLFNHKDIVNELLSEIPEIADVSEYVSRLWQNPGEGSFMPAKCDNVVMVEEPWLNGTPCSHTGNIDASKDSPHLYDIRKEVAEDNSETPLCLENITREDMEIVLLGTGSSQPSKYRNVSAIFVNLFAKGSLLLDCGEGTLAQLKRRFGVKGADDAVKSLKCIWISHIHADHHTGLARILALRSQLLKNVPHEPLLVVGPRSLKRFLDAYSRLEDLDMQFLDCRHTTEASLDAFYVHASGKECSPEHVGNMDNSSEGIETASSQDLESTLFSQSSRMQSYWKRPGSPVDSMVVLPILKRLKEMLCEAGLEALYSVPVLHCPHAFAVVIKAAERINSVEKTIPGWKLVYSGDTRPCQSLIDASHDATVLIHEATFEDGMEDEAIARNHSTTMEAINVGASAGAYRIILTHFSQRYPKIPVFNDADMHRTCIAFDLMSVNAADLTVLPEILPHLKVLFRNEIIADEPDVLESASHQ